MPTKKELDEYRAALACHDWTFELSDDQRVWRAGWDQRQALMQLQARLDPDKAIWNSYDPTLLRPATEAVNWDALPWLAGRNLRDFWWSLMLENIELTPQQFMRVVRGLEVLRPEGQASAIPAPEGAQRQIQAAQETLRRLGAGEAQPPVQGSKS